MAANMDVRIQYRRKKALKVQPLNFSCSSNPGLQEIKARPGLSVAISTTGNNCPQGQKTARYSFRVGTM